MATVTVAPAGIPVIWECSGWWSIKTFGFTSGASALTGRPPPPPSWCITTDGGKVTVWTVDGAGGGASLRRATTASGVDDDDDEEEEGTASVVGLALVACADCGFPLWSPATDTGSTVRADCAAFPFIAPFAHYELPRWVMAPLSSPNKSTKSICRYKL